MCGLRKAEEAAIGGEMPGVTKYNLVDDAHDLRIPMHNDEVFKHGVCFEAKVRAGFNLNTHLFTVFTADSLSTTYLTRFYDARFLGYF